MGMGALLARVCPSRNAAVPCQPESCFYLNFKIVNFEEALPALIESKLHDKGVNSVVTSMAGHVGAVLAMRPKVALAFSDKITQVLSIKLPEVFGEMGISVDLKKVYSSARWIVLRCEVLEVDLSKLLHSEKVNKGELADTVAPLLSFATQYTALPTLVRSTFQSKLKTQLEMMLPSKLWQKAGFKVVVISRWSSEQAEFFFDTVQPIPAALEYKLLNRTGGLEELIHNLHREKLGRLGILTGKVAGKIATKTASDKLVAERLGQFAVTPQIIQTAEMAGIHLEVVQRSVDADGNGVINLNISHIELDKLGVHSEQAAYFRLGHAERNEVVSAALARIKQGLADFFEQKKVAATFDVHRGHKIKLAMELTLEDDGAEMELPPGV